MEQSSICYSLFGSYGNCFDIHLIGDNGIIIGGFTGVIVAMILF